jgi:hypothetical protein
MQDQPNTASVWLGPRQVELLGRAIALTPLSVVAVGGAGAHGFREQFSGRHEPRMVDDLRSLLAMTEAGMVILADPGRFGDGQSPGDLRTIVAAAARGVTVASLEPMPAHSLHLSLPAWREASPVTRERVAFLPLARRSAAFRTAAELLHAFGPIEALAITTLGGGSEGSLGARLLGACDLLIALLDLPLSAQALHTATSEHPETPELLRGLHGHLAATFAFAGGQSASLFASDRAATWSRSIVMLGPGGRLVADDTRADWFDAAGLHVETITAPLRGDDLAAAVIADDLNALLGHAPRVAPADLASVLATAHAALLSAKTGNAEQPGELRRLSGAPPIV